MTEAFQEKVMTIEERLAILEAKWKEECSDQRGLGGLLELAKEQMKAAVADEKERCAKILDRQEAHRKKLKEESLSRDESWKATALCHSDCEIECSRMAAAIRR